MDNGSALARMRQVVIAGAKQAQLRKGLTAFLAVILFLQLYFVRELIAAELLFGIGFLVFLALVALFYAIGSLGERAFTGVREGFSAAAPVVRREYLRLQETSKGVLGASAPRARRVYLWLEETGKARFRAVAPAARRAYLRVEEISKKPFRHPRSESAQ